MRVFFAPLRASPKMLAIISTSLLFREELSSTSDLLCINRTPNAFYFEAKYKDRNAYKRLVAHAARARLKGAREKIGEEEYVKITITKEDYDALANLAEQQAGMLINACAQGFLQN